MENDFNRSLFYTGSSDILPAPSAEYHSDILLPDLKDTLYRLLDVYAFDAGSVYLPVIGKPNTFEIKASLGFTQAYLKDTNEIKTGIGFCGTALGLNEIRVTEDTQHDSRYNRPLIKEIGFKSFVAIPLHQEIGLINLASYKERTFISSELSMFSFIGQKIGSLCRTRLLLYEAMEHVQISKRLTILSKELMQGRDINQIALLVVEECRVALSCPASFLLFMSESLSFIRSAGIRKDTLTKELKKHLAAQSQRKDVFVLSVKSSDKAVQDFLHRNNLHALYCANIEGQSGYMGIICVGRTQKAKALNGNELEAFRRIIRQLGSTIDRYLFNKQLTTVAILEEQNRISRELHDSMAQQIATIQKQAEYMQYVLSQQEAVTAGLDEEFTLMFKMLGNLYDDTREIISGLRTFESSGYFESSLKHYLIYYKQHNPIQVKLDMEPNLQMPSFTQLQVLRIIQEALSNVRKHSQGKNVDISIVKEDKGLRITIKDDGIGFNANDDSHDLQRFGLAIMRERTESIEGQLQIISAPGQGTEVELYVPTTNLVF